MIMVFIVSPNDRTQNKGQNDKVVVSIELLHRSLAVEIEDWALEKIS